MAVHNAAPYLSEAIDSILGQTYEDFELIVCNDGSTDGSETILQQYADRDPRVVFLNRSQNRGLIFTRNELLDRAQGEYTAVMDSDDVAVPERFARQVAFLDSHPDYVLVGSRILLIDPEGNPMCALDIRETHEEIDAWHMNAKSGSAISNPTVMMRTAAVRAVGGYHDDTNCAEDYDLFLRLAERGRLYTMPEVLLHYRQHLASIGYARNADQRQAILRSVEKACARRGLPLPENMINPVIPKRTISYAYRQWAEWALRGGNASTARRYALRSLRHAPWSPRSWRTLARACIRPKTRRSPSTRST